MIGAFLAKVSERPRRTSASEEMPPNTPPTDPHSAGNAAASPPLRSDIWRACDAVDVHQSTALLDALYLRLRDQRMVLDVVDRLRPGKRKRNAEKSHEPEAASPAIAADEPCKKRTEDHQRRI